jgi:hypothetical protein
VFNWAAVPILLLIVPVTVEAFVMSPLNRLPEDFASAFETSDNKKVTISPDINRSEGRLFSYEIIYCVNLFSDRYLYTI